MQHYIHAELAGWPSVCVMPEPLRRILSIEQRTSLAYHWIASTIYLPDQPLCAWRHLYTRQTGFGYLYLIYVLPYREVTSVCRAKSCSSPRLKSILRRVIPPLPIVVVISAQNTQIFQTSSYLFKSNQILATGGWKASIMCYTSLRIRYPREHNVQN